jgi:nucleotide-binding universal stress UspA family protein
MFERILVPLDGSSLSELALQPAFQFAERFGALVNLLRVVVVEALVFGPEGIGPQSMQLRELSEKQDWAEAEAYLNAIMAHWQATGVPIAKRVAIGAAPEMIVTVAAQFSVDLIVMSTHGRSGLTRFLYGSVAEAVLRGTERPLLLVPVK